jgi:lipopolysaccharide export LptBFGC system permease protein LptF
MQRVRDQDARVLGRYRLQVHWALALPLACLVFAVLGGPMTLRFARGGSLTGALLALAVMCVYYLLKLWSDMLGNTGALPPAVAAWWQTVLFGGIGVWLLLRAR